MHNGGIKYTTERMLIYHQRAETRRQTPALADLSWERAHGRLKFLAVPLCTCQGIAVKLP